MMSLVVTKLNGVSMSSVLSTLRQDGGSANGSAPVARENRPPIRVNGSILRPFSSQPRTSP